MNQPAQLGVQKIQTMLERFADAFTHGDGKGAAECWDVPALVVSDDGVKAVSETAEVEAFFGGAAEQYNSKGITGTRPEILEVDWLTDRLASVRVRWPYLGDDGRPKKGSESSSYVVRNDDQGAPKIVTAIMLGAKAGR